MGILQIDEQPPLIQAIFSGEFEEVNKCLLECKLDVNCLDCEKRTPLHAAAFKGDALIVSLLLAHGARVNAKDSKWLTPLHRACCTRSEETVSILLRYQADICARDKLWQTPLHVAAANDAYACVARLLNNVPNPNVTDRAGRTALHHAAFSGHTYVAQLLISKGCIVNACDKKDCRPIHCAAHMGHIDTIELLLQYGADINAKDRNQYTPLHAAAASGMENVCHLLLNAGAEVNAQNAYGNTPLHVACLNGHVTICQELLLYKGNIEATNYRGQTPLHIAAASTHGVDCLLYLLEQDVNINTQSLDGRTPLHMTAIHGRFTRSKTLIDRGAAVDCTDKNGCTPLHIAAQYGHDLLANTLLTYGADPKRREFEGRTALHMCCLSGHIECCRKFIQAGVDLNCQDHSGKTATHCAAYKGSVECLDLLVSSSANFQIVDNIGRIALHYAAAQGHFSCVFTLVSIGSPVNAPDSLGCTALHLAAAYDMDGKCVEYLIQHKANPKLKDKNGFTPLHYAVCGGNVTAVIHLLSETTRNEPSTVNNVQSTTPLHLAAKNGNVDILRLILPYFPDTNVKAVNGVTPLMLAAREGHPNCVQMLLRFGAKVAIVDDLYNMTAIHYSAKNGNVHCLALLLDNTEDKKVINFNDKFKRTALMLAVSGNHNECVLNLLKSGADPNICDNDMHSSLFRAVVSGQNNVVQLLLNKNAAVSDVDVHGKTVLHLAAACGHFSCLQSLLHRMSKEVVTVLDKQQCTALHWACYNGSPACVEYLLQKDFFKIRDGNPFSPVHCAAYSGSEKCLELLYTHQGAEIIHLTDSKGRTPLHIASLHGHTECVKFLLDKGADTEIQDVDGRTAFITAAQYGQSQIIELLLGYNANSSSYDKNGNTPLHWACLKKHSHTALLLLEYVTGPEIVNMINNDRKTPLHIAARNGLVQVTRDLIQKGANVMAVDAEGLTPALCCAPNKNVAQCLSIILHSYTTTSSQGENFPSFPPVPVLTPQKVSKPCVKVKRMKTETAQTDMTLLHDPDLFECQRLFNLKMPSQSVPSKFKVTRTKADKLPKNDIGKIKKRQTYSLDGHDQGKNDLEEKPDGGFGLSLHKSHSDMYIPFKSSLEDLTKPKYLNSTNNKKDFFNMPASYCMVESTRTCIDCLQLNKKCSDCTIKKLFKQQSQGRINKQEFQYLLMKTCCEGTTEQPSYVSKVLDDLTKTYIRNFGDEDEDLKQRLMKKRTEGVSSVQCVKKTPAKSPKNDQGHPSRETPIDKLYQQMLNPITKKVLEDVSKKHPSPKRHHHDTSKKSSNKSNGDVKDGTDNTGEIKSKEHKNIDNRDKIVTLNVEALKVLNVEIGEEPKKETTTPKKDLNIIICDNSEVDRKNDEESIIEELFCKNITEIAQAKRAELRNERFKVIESVSDEDVLNLGKVAEEAEVEQAKANNSDTENISDDSDPLAKKQIKVIHSNLKLLKDTDYLDEVVNYVQGIVKNLNLQNDTNVIVDDNNKDTGFKIVNETSPNRETEMIEIKPMGDGEKLSTYHTIVCDTSKKEKVSSSDKNGGVLLKSKTSNSINTDISGEISNVAPKKSQFERTPHRTDTHQGHHR